MRFADPAHDRHRRRRLLEIFDAALDAVDPYAAVTRAIRADGPTVQIGEETFEVTGRVIILALGKAAHAMARAATNILGGSGVVVAPDAGTSLMTTLVGDHPIPTVRSAAGATALLAAARQAGPDDLVVVLISGGGSALAELPAPGLALADVQTVYRSMLHSGLAVGDTNIVRRHLSAIKNGRLAATAAPARVATLVLSDVVGDRPSDVSSGPTLPDGSTSADALAILAAEGLTVPPSIIGHLSRDRPTIELASTAVLVGSGVVAANAAVAAARHRGIDATVGTMDLTGRARAVGRDLALSAPRGLAVHAGETTVTVTGTGAGGRNQEVALAAGIALEGADDAVVAAIGTDGVDGPTEAAGAFGDRTTVERGSRRGLDARQSLDDNDSNTYLAACGDLIESGPTGTNVADLIITWRD